MLDLNSDLNAGQNDKRAHTGDHPQASREVLCVLLWKSMNT